MVSSLKERERAESERSAQEAAQTASANLATEPEQVARYYNPPADTIHPLEYAFHILGDVRGKTILEYGCGDGVNTVPLVKRGAHVIALDLSPELIAVAKQRLLAHGITTGVDFVVGSAHSLPLLKGSVDVVFGIAILHHLDLAVASNEVWRVLKMHGVVIFQEPVRNSRIMRFVRKLIPYRSPDVSPFERPLTDRELKNFAAEYSSYRSRSFCLPTTGLLNLILSPFYKNCTEKLLQYDAAIVKRFPALGYFSAVKVIQIIK